MTILAFTKKRESFKNCPNLYYTRFNDLRWEGQILLMSFEDIGKKKVSKYKEKCGLPVNCRLARSQVRTERWSGDREVSRMATCHHQPCWPANTRLRLSGPVMRLQPGHQGTHPSGNTLRLILCPLLLPASPGISSVQPLQTRNIRELYAK